MDKITELINKKGYYVIRKLTSFKTNPSDNIPGVELIMYDSNDNLIESFVGGEHDDYNSIYDGLNEKLEKLFPESLYKYGHIEILIDKINNVELSAPEHLRNKLVIVRRNDGGYKLLLKTTTQDNVILSFDLLQSSNMISVNAITLFGHDLSRLHSYIRIIEQYLKVPAKERRKELNSIDNFEDLM